jgi:hypothetical protein
MWTDAQIEAAAAAAAEKANGGKFSDPLFYKPEHKAFWRDVVRTALDAADAKPAPLAPAKPTPEEVATFSSHCVYIRSVYTLTMRIWRHSNDAERNTMEAVAPLFFEDVGQVLSEFIVNCACRVTERAVDAQGNENLTVELFLQGFPTDSDTYKKLNELYERMKRHRRTILPARNKLGAHADREIIRKGKPLGAASWKEWDDFWFGLEQFVSILNQSTTGEPFDIKAAGVTGDAESLLKALKGSQHFDALLNSENAEVQKACQQLATSDREAS